MRPLIVDTRWTDCNISYCVVPRDAEEDHEVSMGIVEIARGPYAAESKRDRETLSSGSELAVIWSLTARKSLIQDGEMSE